MANYLRSYFFPVLVSVLFANSLTAQTNGPVVIPVVFHVLHLGGEENISDAQVLDGIRILNRDYNKQNADTANVIAAYKNNIANMGITFRLANIDPNGNCTNGIEHIYTSEAYKGGGDGAYIHDWPRDKYLNIWTYAAFETEGGAEDTYYPWYADALPTKDGIAILSNYIGGTNLALHFTGSDYTSRALIVEAAKYLGLIEPYGGFGACIDDDSVADTPPFSSFISSIDCDTSIVSCDTPYIINFQNFMHYSYCSCMFTNGQKQRVYSYLNRSTAQRNNLYTPANLIATGTNNITPVPCAPIADFSVNHQFICLGQQVTFIDNSYNANITGRVWTFSNANISTDTAHSVNITFNTPGWQTVTLQVMSDHGSATSTQTLVYVANTSTPEIATPYYTGFEDTAAVSQSWVSVNVNNDQTFFHPVSNAGHGGNSSVLLNNFNSLIDGNEDDLISPAFNCTGIADSTLSFWYSYATRSPVLNASLQDSFAVSASADCNATWSVLYHNSGFNLINEGINTNYFIPPNSNYWQQVTVPLPAALRTEYVRFKFSVLGADNSNNFYIDDFNLGSAPTGINEKRENAFTLFPNPFTSDVIIRGLNASNYQVSIMDVTGRTILAYPEILPDKNGNAAIDLSAIHSAGMYFITISNSTTVATLKIMRQ